MASKSNTTKIVTQSLELPVKLSPDQKLEIGARAAALQVDIGKREERRKVATRKINDLRKAMKTDLEAVDSGEETQAVPCEIRYNFRNQSVKTVRLDTNAVVNEETMTKEQLDEAQTEADYSA